MSTTVSTDLVDWGSDVSLAFVESRVPCTVVDVS